MPQNKRQGKFSSQDPQVTARYSNTLQALIARYVNLKVLGIPSLKFVMLPFSLGRVNVLC